MPAVRLNGIDLRPAASVLDRTTLRPTGHHTLVTGCLDLYGGRSIPHVGPSQGADPAPRDGVRPAAPGPAAPFAPDREVAEGLSRPQLVIRRPWSDSRAARLRAYLGRNDSAAYDVVVDETIHMSYSDLPFVEPERHQATIGADRAHAIISSVTLGFLQDHLRGARTTALVEAASAYPEASLHRFGAAGPDDEQEGAREISATVGEQPSAAHGRFSGRARSRTVSEPKPTC